MASRTKPSNSTDSLVFSAWGVSDTGTRRDHNEDSYLVETSLGLFAVADGMGGHQGGARASNMAMEILSKSIAEVEGDYLVGAERLDELSRRRWVELDDDEAFRQTEEIDTGRSRRETQRLPEFEDTDPERRILTPPSKVMELAASRASYEIFKVASRNSELRGMGTTMTAMLVSDGKMHLAHAGDSRAYLFRDQKLAQLTDDHSWIREQVQAGTMTEDEARASEFRHVITRSIGFEADVDIDTVVVEAQAGDCFLLCTDGLTNYFENDELEKLMGDGDLEGLPQRLVDLANDRGGDDNITVVLVQVRAAE